MNGFRPTTGSMVSGPVRHEAENHDDLRHILLLMFTLRFPFVDADMDGGGKKKASLGCLTAPTEAKQKMDTIRYHLSRPEPNKNP